MSSKIYLYVQTLQSDNSLFRRDIKKYNFPIFNQQGTIIAWWAELINIVFSKII